jgi:thioredoxin 1
MKDAYKPVWVILFVAAGLAAVVGVSRLTGGGAGGGEPERVPWTTDLDAATARSAKENKPVLVYFTASWCGPCQRMKSTTWADERVAAAVGRYLPVKVDIDDQPAVARQFGVQSIPRVEVLDRAGGRHVVAEGGVTPDELLSLLAQAGGT